MQNAIVTGVIGQDGSYLAELLLSEGYNVTGVYRRISSGTNYDNVSECLSNPNFNLIEGDICDSGFMTGLVINQKPELFFNLAAQSHVGYSFETPAETFRVNAEAVVGQLDIIRKHSPETRFYQASTSEMFGGLNCPVNGYDESSAFGPRSPYAVAKVAAHYAVNNYRAAYNIYACSGILFNHSSVRRPKDFATRKIVDGVVRVKNGLQEHVQMGNLAACRDEGHSRDYVKAMYMMLHNENGPTDYVVSTGVTVSIETMFKYVCEDLAGLKFEDVYQVNPKYMRPSEVHYLVGNSNKIKEELGWEPNYTWKDTLREMYESDVKSVR